MGKHPLTWGSVEAFVEAMASILKKPSSRSPFWFAAYRGPDGRRVQKSTKTTDRKLAMKLAFEWEELASKGRAGGLVAAQARKVVSGIVEMATGEALHFATAADYLKGWLAGQEGATSPATFYKYKQVITEFISTLDKQAKLPLAGVSSAHLTAYRDKSRSMGRAPGSVNNLMKILTSAFEQAHRDGLIPHNPGKAVPRLKDADKKRKAVFTLEQIQTLLKAANDEFKGLILFGYFTGLRLMDIANLSWGNIDMEKGQMALTTRKTGRELLVHLHPDILDWLRSRIRGTPKAFLFPDVNHTSGSHLSRAFSQFMERAGVVGELIRKKTGSAGRNLNGLTFHSLRHTCISAMANAGIAEELRMEVVGQETGAVHKVYTHHESERLRLATASIPGIFARGGGA